MSTTEKRKLKILYVGNFSPKSVGEPEIAYALERLGHEVTKVDEEQGIIPKLRTMLWAREKYDFLLFAKFRVGTHEEIRDFLRDLRGIKIPSVCWLFDLYWGYRRENEIAYNMSPWTGADIVLTTDGGHDDKWKKYGIQHFLLRQGIDERVKMGSATFDTKAQIGFVGSRLTWAGWPYRGRLLDFLSVAYEDKFEHFGSDGKLRHEELGNLLATLKITICDTVYSPYYWSNRIYEMMGRGGFVIHPRIEGLEKEFEEYKHFIPYKVGNFKDLKQKIDYYLEHNEERETIRKAGFEHVHKNLTYTHRVKELIQRLEEQKII